MNKKELGKILSRLRTFTKPKVDLEQYQTEAEIAAEAIWDSYLNKDIKDKSIVDLGCGTGIFGLGALILNARNVKFVDLDREALELAKENKKFLEKLLEKKFKASFINKDIRDYDGRGDVVIQNPPFGTKHRHYDKLFLIRAMKIANVIYSFHKLSTRDFIDKFCKEHGFRVVSVKKIKFPIRNIFKFHRKKIYFTAVGYWKIVKSK